MLILSPLGAEPQQYTTDTFNAQYQQILKPDLRGLQKGTSLKIQATPGAGVRFNEYVLYENDRSLPFCVVAYKRVQNLH